MRLDTSADQILKIMTTAERDAMAHPEGLLILNKDTGRMNLHMNDTWQEVLTDVTDSRSLWPVGSLFSTSLPDNNPHALLGYGVWQEYGVGDLQDFDSKVPNKNEFYMWLRIA